MSVTRIEREFPGSIRTIEGKLDLDSGHYLTRDQVKETLTRSQNSGETSGDRQGVDANFLS